MGGGGFKKKKVSSKQKAKKSSKKKTVDKEWAHEGGTKFDGEVEEAQARKRARRETQDRDERLRRGRAKMSYQKEQRDALKKMKRGLSFQGELKKEAEENAEEVVEEEVVPHVQFKSSKSVLSRLQSMVASSWSGAAAASEGLDAIDSGSEGEDEDEDASEDDEKEEESVEEEPVEVDLSTGAAVSDRYSWFFDSESTASSAPSTYRPLGNVLGLSVLEQLSGCTDTESLANTRCPRWGDIPGLHKSFKRSADQPLDRFSQAMLPYFLSYADIFFDGCDHNNISDVERTLGVHVAQHIVRSRAVMQKNNEKLKRKKLKAADKAKAKKISGILDAASDDDDAVGSVSEGEGQETRRKSTRQSKRKEEAEPVPATDEEDQAGMQDQGFTRPRILILCPFRSSARRLINSLVAALGEESTAVGGLDKFNEEFGCPEDVEDDEDGPRSKPADWKAIFNDNTDDDFKMGIQITPGQGKGTGANKGALVRLYSDFYLSDIIIASPLGLRLVVSSKENMSYDFLSSIEMTYMHQADVLYMQNWDHVTHIFQHLNHMPKHDHDTDFSRVRPYFLEERAGERSQLVVTSKFNDPLIWSVFRKYGRSIAGHMRFKTEVNEVGCLGEVTARVKQIFQMIPCADPTQLEAVRFDYFKKNVLGPMLRLNQTRTLIVTPSYISYVKVRNELIRNEANAAFVCEYSRDSEISRGRSRFYHGHNDILVYSGRAHFFRRFLIRGACHIIFYSLPEYAHFYSELVNTIQEVDAENSAAGNNGANSLSCTVLFTKFEKMALERIVGAKRCEHMLSTGKSTFMFC